MPRCLLVFEPPDGGVADHALRLALGLPEHGWEPWVAGPPAAVVYPALEEAGVRVLRLPFQRGYRHPARDAATLRDLTALLRRERFDLVHAHSAKAGVVGRAAALASRTPAVYTPHCFAFIGPWGWRRRVFAVAVERAMARASRAIVCVAEEERRRALEQRVAPPEKLHVVHNGCPPCDPDVDPDPALAGFAAEGPLVACISVLRRQKAVHVLLEAAPLILDRVPEARIAVVGGGELRESLEAAAPRDERVRFFDFAAPPARQLASIEVFVLPSEWEAFPISVLEAMACGVSQVATDVGGTAEALVDGETGLLCPPGDPAALAARVCELLLDPDRRRRMGEAARGRYEERFRLERMLAGTAAVYERVVS